MNPIRGANMFSSPPHRFGRISGRSNPGGTAYGENGFSLLEMVVAISILSVSLLILYQATSGATHNVRVDEKYTYAILLAESLIADNNIPLASSALSKQGTTDTGYRWMINMEPMTDTNTAIALYQTQVNVSWDEGLEKERTVQLQTVLAGRLE